MKERKHFLNSIAFIIAIATVSFSTVRASEEEAENRDITAPATLTVTATAPKNPSVSTTGTLTILQSVAFAATATSTTKAAISYSWDFGDATPLDTRQNPSHTYTAPGTYTVTLTISEEGNPNPTVKTLSVVITDAIKSSRLLAAFDFKKAGNDQLKLTGTLRVPTGLKSPEVLLDIGGITAKFNLDGRGWSDIKTTNSLVSGALAGETKSSGSFKIFIKKKSEGVSYEDAKFTLKISDATLLSALGDEFIFNRDADRESLRVVGKITINGALYQSTLSPVFSAVKDSKGNLR